MKKIFSPGVLKLIKHESITSGNFHPIAAPIMLTSACNLRCPFCFDSLHSSVEMPFEDLVRILRLLGFYGGKSVQFVGRGEPTLYSNFASAVETARSFGFKLGLITNGTRISKLNPEVSFSDFDWVRVSINSSPLDYERLHGSDKFNSVIDGLCVLSDVGTDFGISFVLSRYNLWKDSVALLQEIAKRNIKNLKYLRITRDYTESSILYEDVSVVGALQDIICSLGGTLDIQVNKAFWIPAKCLLYKIKPCFDVDGLVYPCCAMLYNKSNSIGNFKDFSYKKDYIVDTSLCSYCTYGAVNNFLCHIISTQVEHVDFI